MTASVGGAKLVVLSITSAACAQALRLSKHVALKPMGTFWICKTSFVCKDNELNWGQQFIHSDPNSTPVQLPGTKPAADMGEQEAPVYKCDITENGRVITLGSYGYGIFNPSRMNLPKSLLAVVHSIVSTQGEEQDFTVAVQADRVRNTDFSPYAKASQQFNFDLEDKLGKKFNELEENEKLSEDEIYRIHDDFRNEQEQLRARIHTVLVSNVIYFGIHKGLTAPFLEYPKMASYEHWLSKALPNWKNDYDDAMAVPLPYTSTEVWSSNATEPLPPAELVVDLTSDQQAMLQAEEDAVRKAQEEYAAKEALRMKRLDESIAAARKREQEQMANTSADEFFEECDGSGDYSPLFRNADDYREQITKNIATIAETCNEDNPVLVTEDMPTWLLELFKQGGVATC